MIEIKEEDLKRVSEEAIRVAITNVLVKSGEVNKQIGEVVKEMGLEIKPIILEAFKKAAARICEDTNFIDELLAQTILENRDKLTGAFNGALSKAGRELGLDRETLRGLSEKVKDEISVRNEVLGVGQFS